MVAFAARLALGFAQPYGDEAAHYWVARHFGGFPAGLTPAYPDFTHAIWWQRPLFSLLMWPGTASFEAYRVLHILIASTVPVLAALLVRRAAPLPLAIAAGLVLAIHPTMVVWGARVFPDALMAALVLGAMLAYRPAPDTAAPRVLATAGLLLAAVWVKETAAVALLGVTLHAGWTAHRRGACRIWPLTLDKATTALAAACVVAPMPLAVALVVFDGAVPGWARAPFTWNVLDTVLLTSWLTVPVVAALAFPASRRPAALALAYVGFYLGYSVIEHEVEGWYAVLPAALAVIAVARAIAALRVSWGQLRAAVVGLVIAMVVVAPALVPSDAGDALTPITAGAPQSLAELGHDPKSDLTLTASWVAQRGPSSLQLVDVGWFYVLHPFGEAAPESHFTYSQFESNMTSLAAGIESRDLTVVQHTDHSLNGRIRFAYADCVQATFGDYTLIEGRLCPGRSAQLGGPATAA